MTGDIFTHQPGFLQDSSGFCVPVRVSSSYVE
jgi:hypothetical protein